MTTDKIEETITKIAERKKCAFGIKITPTKMLNRLSRNAKQRCYMTQQKCRATYDAIINSYVLNPDERINS